MIATSLSPLTIEEKNLLIKIASFQKDFNDLPDGAFFALAEQYGIDVSDWAWFAEQAESKQAHAILKTLNLLSI